MLVTNEKAWLFHRGKWTIVKNPLYRKEIPDGNERRSSLQEYRRKWWRIGPTFLYPNYSGILIYTYAYTGSRNLPEYLVWIDSKGLNVTIFAKDLPDLFDVLALLAPLVLTGLFVDLYRRSQEEEN